MGDSQFRVGRPTDLTDTTTAGYSNPASLEDQLACNLSPATSVPKGRQSIAQGVTGLCKCYHVLLPEEQ